MKKLILISALLFSFNSWAGTGKTVIDLFCKGAVQEYDFSTYLVYEELRPGQSFKVRIVIKPTGNAALQLYDSTAYFEIKEFYGVEVDDTFFKARDVRKGKKYGNLFFNKGLVTTFIKIDRITGQISGSRSTDSTFSPVFLDGECNTSDKPKF